MHRVASLPNMQYDRSIYNRSVGKSDLASVSEHNDARGHGQAKQRAMEFDMLLNDL